MATTEGARLGLGISDWDMHDASAVPVVDEDDRLAVATRVTGVVVCHHVFGLGVLGYSGDQLRLTLREE